MALSMNAASSHRTDWIQWLKMGMIHVKHLWSLQPNIMMFVVIWSVKENYSIWMQSNTYSSWCW